MASAPLSATQSHPASAAAKWLGTIRTILAIAIAWALFHYGLDGRVFPRTANEPLLISAGPLGIGGAVVAGLLWCVAAAIAHFVGGRPDPLAGLRLSAAGVAIWAFSGATIDDWLIEQNPAIAAPTAGPYRALLPDYIALLVTVVAAAAISVRLSAQPGSKSSLAATLGRGGSAARQKANLSGQLAALILGIVLIPMLMGPIQAHTRVLQVYFAVSAGLWMTIYFARKIVPESDPTALWPLPWVLGLLGVVAAIVWPAMQVPLEYRGLNSLAAWGLVRALPIQMVSVGIATILWTAYRSPLPAEAAPTAVSAPATPTPA